MTYVIIAALALIVLITIILFFTGALGIFSQQQQQIVEGATDQQLEIWRGQCQLYASLGQEESWNQHEFTASNGDIYNCEELMAATWDEWTAD